MASARRTAKLVTAAIAVGAAAWTAAPALSLGPYSPQPVEFHQPLPELRAVARAAAARGPQSHLYVSAVARAPKRFDLVGIGAERRPVEYRYRSAGGPWSMWLRVDAGDPVWSGGADFVQVRSRGFRPSGNLDYINLSGTGSAADRLLTAARSAIHSALVSAASLAGATASAAPAEPDFIPRAGWDPNHRCRPRVPPTYGRVKAAVVHHTVMGGNSYSRTEARRIVLGICLFHRNDNGWNDIGYNALSDRFGRLFAGRAGGVGSAVIGAHTLGFNDQTTGIASIGDHRHAPIGAAERHALIHFLAWKLPRHGAVPADGQTTLVSGGGSGNRYSSGTHVRISRVTMHRRLNSTACPGDSLAGQISLIRRRTQARIEASR